MSNNKEGEKIETLEEEIVDKKEEIINLGSLNSKS